MFAPSDGLLFQFSLRLNSSYLSQSQSMRLSQTGLCLSVNFSLVFIVVPVFALSKS